MRSNVFPFATRGSREQRTKEPTAASQRASEQASEQQLLLLCCSGSDPCVGLFVSRCFSRFSTILKRFPKFSRRYASCTAAATAGDVRHVYYPFAATTSTAKYCDYYDCISASLFLSSVVGLWVPGPCVSYRSSQQPDARLYSGLASLPPAWLSFSFSTALSCSLSISLSLAISLPRISAPRCDRRVGGLVRRPFAPLPVYARFDVLCVFVCYRCLLRHSVNLMHYVFSSYATLSVFQDRRLKWESPCMCCLSVRCLKLKWYNSYDTLCTLTHPLCEEGASIVNIVPSQTSQSSANTLLPSITTTNLTLAKNHLNPIHSLPFRFFLLPKTGTSFGQSPVLVCGKSVSLSLPPLPTTIIANFPTINDLAPHNLIIRLKY